MIKKYVTFLLALLMIAAMMIGCETDDKEPNEDGESTEESEEADGAQETAAENAVGKAPVLSVLKIGGGMLSPAFDPNVTAYTVEVGADTQTVVINPTVEKAGWGSADLTFKVSTRAVSAVSGNSVTVALEEGDTEVRITAYNENTGEETVYTVTFVREHIGNEDGTDDGTGDITEDEEYSDMALISRLLGMTREEAFDLLGNNYTVVPAGGEGWLEGYQYTDRGMTLMFYPEDYTADPENGIMEEDLNKVLSVTCDKKVNIFGARVGMTLDEIKAVLGTPTETYPADEYYSDDIAYFESSRLNISFSFNPESHISTMADISRLWQDIE